MFHRESYAAACSLISLVHQWHGGKQINLIGFCRRDGVGKCRKTLSRNLLLEGRIATTRCHLVNIRGIGKETQPVRRIVRPVFYGRVRPRASIARPFHLLIEHESRCSGTLIEITVRQVGENPYRGEVGSVQFGTCP